MRSRLVFSHVILAVALMTALLVERQASAMTFTSDTGHNYTTTLGPTWYIYGDSDTVAVDTSRVIVRVVEDSTLTEPILSAHGFGSTELLGNIVNNYYILCNPSSSGCEAYLDSLEADPLIEWACYDVIGEFYFTPNDEYYPDQWSLHDAHTLMQSAWDLTGSVSGIKVGIIDSGCDVGHPDLPTTSTTWRSLRPPAVDTFPGHGTCTMGIISANTNNTIGVAGIAGDGDYFFWAIGTGQSTFNFSDLTAAITEATYEGVQVLSLSLGVRLTTTEVYEWLPFMEAALGLAVDNDMVIVAASGNVLAHEREGLTLAYPASSDSTIGVCSVTEGGVRGGYYRSGSIGAGLDVAAPGGYGIVTTDARGSDGFDPSDYTTTYFFGGTSAAAPFVAGVAAQVLAEKPYFTWRQVRDCIRHGAKKVPAMGGAYYHNEWGYGVVSALGSIVAARHQAQLIEGTLAGTQTLPNPSSVLPNLYARSDIVVDSAATVTIADSTIVYVAPTDGADLGADPDRIEWIVENDGVLNVNGTSSDSVVFRSSSGDYTTHDDLWYGVTVDSAGSAFITYADVSNALYGVSVYKPDTLRVTHSYLHLNSNVDLKLNGGGSHLAVDVSDSYLEIKGGDGINVLNAPSGCLIQDNTLVGNENTSNGICIGSSGSASPTVTHNSVSGVSTGNAIYIKGSSSAPTLTENTCEDSKYGIYVENCAPTIGTSSSSSDNFILNNSTTGLYVEGSGGTPTVRNNQISGNYHGVVGKTSANPNLGTSGSNGNNSIVSSTGYCLWNRTTGGGAPTIQAYGNWWGSEDPPTCTNGSVNVGGWLATQPASIGRGIQVEAVGSYPFRLRGAWPNPMSKSVVIQFETKGKASVMRTMVFDLGGRLVRDLGEQVVTEGVHEAMWNGQNEHGQDVPSGIYFVKLSQDDTNHETIKVLVAR